jgi:hypothetical protein
VVGRASRVELLADRLLDAAGKRDAANVGRILAGRDGRRDRKACALVVGEIAAVQREPRDAEDGRTVVELTVGDDRSPRIAGRRERRERADDRAGDDRARLLGGARTAGGVRLDDRVERHREVDRRGVVDHGMGVLGGQLGAHRSVGHRAD